MIYFIDSNIFLRVLHKENEKAFRDCYGILKLVKENKITAVTATIVLAEIVWTLGSFYNIPKADIANGLRGIINLNGLNIEDAHDYTLALKIYERFPVKFIDAMIASNKDIYSGKITIISYDRDFDKLPVKRAEPPEILRD